MQNKIIFKIFFYSIAFILAIVIKPMVNFLIESSQCKADLLRSQTLENINKNSILTTKKYVKKNREKNINTGDINYRRELLKKINPSN